MTDTDRLYEVLRSYSNAYYETAKTLATIPVCDEHQATRQSLAARMATLVVCGDELAEAIGVAAPLWDDMRGLAGLPW